MRLKLIAILTLMICTNVALQAQTSSENIIPILEKIHRNYDSIKYLSFDVKFDYGSDTLLGKYVAEAMDANFTMTGNKAKYKIGDIDFLQNDNYFIAVYNKDKIIIVDEPKFKNAGSQLPLRQQIDSLVYNYSSSYHFNIPEESSDTGHIELTRADSLAQFDKLIITYDKRNFLLYQLYYEFTDVAELEPAVLESLRSSKGENYIPFQTKRFSINFSNYKFANYDNKSYSENIYIWFDNGNCKPVNKYSDYKLYYHKPTVQ